MKGTLIVTMFAYQCQSHSTVHYQRSSQYSGHNSNLSNVWDLCSIYLFQKLKVTYQQLRIFVVMCVATKYCFRAVNSLCISSVISTLGNASYGCATTAATLCNKHKCITVPG